MSKFVVVWECDNGSTPICTGYGQLTDGEIETLRETVEKYSPYDYASVDTYTQQHYDALKEISKEWKEGKL